MERPTIGLLTDFGYEDTYVGQMKCVIADICPDAQVIDLCNRVPPQNILSGAYLAATVAPVLPSGGVMTGVIDPGVGSARRAIAVELEDSFLVGPDNGLFELVLRNHPPERIVEVNNTDYFLEEVSSTFHGRDIFSPVAAYIADGLDIAELGPAVDPDELEGLPPCDPFIRENRIEAHVIHIDRFGNLIANLTREELLDWLGDSEPLLELEGNRVELKKTFDAAQSGEPLAYFGSTDQLEIAVNNGDAERYFGANQGTTVLVRRADD
jgi:hypothetical protein